MNETCPHEDCGYGECSGRWVVDACETHHNNEGKCQRGRQRSREAARQRGVILHRLPEELSVDGMPTALAQDSRRYLYVISTEGVGWEVGMDGFRTNDYDPNARVWSQGELLDLRDAGLDTVDLADWVRTFGARLESNFSLWFNRLS